jgi:hypothetical protein
MKPPKKLPAEIKYETLDRLLFLFGSHAITDIQFWEQMNHHGYGQDDIDAWCTEYYARERAKDDQAQRSTTDKRMGVRRDNPRQ